MPITYGLIGYPLTHSFSKKYFTQKFSALEIPHVQYELFAIDEVSKMKQVIAENPNLIGLNVTQPYKQKVIPFLNALSAEADFVQAVNTIKIYRKENQYTLKGYNTDIYGFEMSIKPFMESHHQRALVLGNGGASKAVQYALKKLGIDFFVVTRNPTAPREIRYTDLTAAHIKHHLFIINTTTVGMFPHSEDMPPIDVEYIGENHFCVDLIYNPEQTLFLKSAANKGAKTMNGLSMLCLQADKAYEIWTANE